MKPVRRMIAKRVLEFSGGLVMNKKSILGWLALVLIFLVQLAYNAGYLIALTVFISSRLRKWRRSVSLWSGRVVHNIWPIYLNRMMSE
jgi:hypothetical protein